MKFSSLCFFNLAPTTFSLGFYFSPRVFVFWSLQQNSYSLANPYLLRHIMRIKVEPACNFSFFFWHRLLSLFSSLLICLVGDWCSDQTSRNQARWFHLLCGQMRFSYCSHLVWPQLRKFRLLKPCLSVNHRRSHWCCSVTELKNTLGCFCVSMV